MPNTFVKIASTTFTGSGNTVTFNSIPQTYSDLKLVQSARSDRGTYTIDETGVYVNGDNSGSTLNNWTYFSSSWSAFASGRGTGNAIWLGVGATTSVDGANIFANGEMYIPNYANTSYFKNNLGAFAAENNAAANAGMMFLQVGNRRSTAAISSLLIIAYGSNLIANSTFTLYGIKNS
jgi:hypothetical protein